MTFTIVIVFFVILLFASLAAYRWWLAVHRPNLFISGGPGGLVAEYTPAGSLVRIFIPPGSGGMTNPQNLRFGPNGNLFVCCHDTSGVGAVKEYDGIDGTYIGDFATGLTSPTDIVFDRGGNAWVAQISTGVSKFSSSGVLLGTYTASLAEPRGIALHADGDILVSIDDYDPLATAGANRIIKLDDATGAPTVWATVGNPQGISSSPSGRFYVCSAPSSGTTTNAAADGIVTRDDSGQPVSSAPAMLADGPEYVVFSNGDLFVTRFGHGVRRFNASTGSLVTSFPDSDSLTPPGSELPIQILSFRGIAVRPTGPARVRDNFRRLLGA